MVPKHFFTPFTWYLREGIKVNGPPELLATSRIVIYKLFWVENYQQIAVLTFCILNFLWRLHYILDGTRVENKSKLILTKRTHVNNLYVSTLTEFLSIRSELMYVHTRENVDEVMDKCHLTCPSLTKGTDSDIEKQEADCVNYRM